MGFVGGTGVIYMKGGGAVEEFERRSMENVGFVDRVERTECT